MHVLVPERRIVLDGAVAYRHHNVGLLKQQVVGLIVPKADASDKVLEIGGVDGASRLISADDGNARLRDEATYDISVFGAARKQSDERNGITRCLDQLRSRTDRFDRCGAEGNRREIGQRVTARRQVDDIHRQADERRTRPRTLCSAKGVGEHFRDR
jgi:hypothetical protein